MKIKTKNSKDIIDKDITMILTKTELNILWNIFKEHEEFLKHHPSNCPYFTIQTIELYPNRIVIVNRNNPKKS